MVFIFVEFTEFWRRQISMEQSHKYIKTDCAKYQEEFTAVV